MTKDITELRALRVNRNPPLTLAALARVLGFSQPTLSVVERGIRGAGDMLISRLALFYRIKPEKMRAICEHTFNPDLRGTTCPKSQRASGRARSRNRRRRK